MGERRATIATPASPLRQPHGQPLGAPQDERPRALGLAGEREPRKPRRAAPASRRGLPGGRAARRDRSACRARSRGADWALNGQIPSLACSQRKPRDAAEPTNTRRVLPAPLAACGATGRRTAAQASERHATPASHVSPPGTRRRRAAAAAASRHDRATWLAADRQSPAAPGHSRGGHVAFAQPTKAPAAEPPSSLGTQKSPRCRNVFVCWPNWFVKKAGNETAPARTLVW